MARSNSEQYSYDELDRLSPTAKRFAMVRMALRVFPLIGNVGAFSRWGDKAALRVESIFACSMTAVIGLEKEAKVANKLSQTLLKIASHDRESSIVNIASIASGASRFGSNSLTDSLTRAIKSVDRLVFENISMRDAVDRALLKDMGILSNRTIAAGAEIDWAFFQRPLFDGAESTIEQWKTSEVGRAFESIGAEGTLKIWEQFYYGRPPGAGEIHSWIARWLEKYPELEKASVVSPSDTASARSSSDRVEPLAQKPQTSVAKEELKSLPRAAQMAFAARCALRVYPLFGVEDSFDRIGDRAKRDTGAVLAASLVAALNHSAAAAAGAAAGGAVFAAYSAEVAAAASAAVNAAADAADADAYASYIAALGSGVNVDAACRRDFEELVRMEFGSDEGPVDWKFFRRNLFEGAETSIEEWITPEIGKAFESIGAGENLDIWSRFFYGEPPGPEEIDSWLVRWMEKYPEQREAKVEKAGLSEAAGESNKEVGAVDSIEERADRPGATSTSESPYQKTYSAFVPDHVAYGRRSLGAPLDDALGVGEHAGHIAQLIAAKDTAMPLSIGLFGAWGAGKSHFMDLLDERLRGLAREPGAVFHSQIVQIRFNAWHYLDTNLWANLVCEIFDQLFLVLATRPGTTEEQVRKLKGELAKQSALAAEANEALAIAEGARIMAEEKLREAKRERIAKENAVGALLDDFKSLKLGDEVKEQLRDAANGLGFPKLESSYAELEALIGEVGSLGGRAKALTLAVFQGKGWRGRSLLLGVAIASPFVVGWFAELNFFKEILSDAVRTLTQLVTALGALLSWISVQIKAGNSIVSKLESAYDAVKKARAERESQGDAANAQKELAAIRQAEEEARHTLREAEEKMKAIRAELAELAPGRQLIRFLNERASTDDYKQHLGLISLVRRDFEKLSQLLTQASQGKDPSLPQIDRIVLYIDDLDRCRADRVVAVLEAVHLLLAFPLFAVVVAVDPRWLRQSLLDHYPRLLGGSGDEISRGKRKSISRPATPQDYLEKIFQVPFYLQSLEKNGYEALVQKLFPVGVAASRKSEGREEPVAVSPLPIDQPSVPRSEGVVEKVVLGEKPKDLPRELVAAEPLAEQTEQVSNQRSADPARLALTKKEVQDVQHFQALFQTPRAVKRFANTYCLIRVGVDEKSWSAYLGSGEEPGNYRVAMLLMAVCSAFPSLARPWLLWLRESPRAEWLFEKGAIDTLCDRNRETTDIAEWQTLDRALESMNLEGWPKPDVECLEEWVRRVARYSF